MSSEKTAPPQYSSPPPSAGTPNSPNAYPQAYGQPGHPGQPQGTPQYVLDPKDQAYQAPLNPVRPLQAGVGDPGATNPDCMHYGHDTHIGCGGITFLVCCFPWSMIW